MTIDPTRLKDQQDFVNLWRNNDYIGTAEWATGTGKTYIGILACKEFTNEDKLVIVPTVYLRSQWLQKIEEENIQNATVLVINTAVKSKYNTQLLILDEIHRYAAETFSEIFRCITYTHILGLTATLERSDRRHYLLEQKCPILSKMRISEALEKGYISDFVMYNYSIKLSDIDKQIYSILDKDFHKKFGFFGHDFGLAMDCLTSEVARIIYGRSKGYDPKTVRINAINFNRAMAKRKEFIYYNQEKLEATKDLIRKFSDKKVIVFAERLSICRELHEEFKDTSGIYDTSISSKKLTETMEKFKDGRLNLLFTAKALDEGMDIPDIDVSIVHSASSSKRQTVQRNGRVLRKQLNKIALIINIYIEDISDEIKSQDKKWLKERIKNIPNTYWVENMEDINYVPGEFILSEEDRYEDFTKRISLFS